MAERLSAITGHLQQSSTPERISFWPNGESLEHTLTRIALPSEGAHGDKDGRATATCYCGAVQIEVPIRGKGLVDTFICHCTDCRKITGRCADRMILVEHIWDVPLTPVTSMFASNFIVRNTHLKHLRGEDRLPRFKQNRKIATGHDMEDSFCSICGTLMYPRSSGFPGTSVPRIGPVDDFSLHESALKPRVETLEKDRCAWLQPALVKEHVSGAEYTAGKPWKSSHDGVSGGGGKQGSSSLSDT